MKMLLIVLAAASAVFATAVTDTDINARNAVTLSNGASSGAAINARSGAVSIPEGGSFNADIDVVLRSALEKRKRCKHGCGAPFCKRRCHDMTDEEEAALAAFDEPIDEEHEWATTPSDDDIIASKSPLEKRKRCKHGCGAPFCKRRCHEMTDEEIAEEDAADAAALAALKLM